MTADFQEFVKRTKRGMGRAAPISHRVPHSNEKAPPLADTFGVDPAQAEADVEAILNDDFVMKLNLMPHMILCTWPHRRFSQQITRTSGGVFIPEQAARVTAEYGLVCSVLKVGRDVPEEIQSYTLIVVPQFAGISVPFSIKAGTAIKVWLIGAGDVIATLDPGSDY